MSRAHQSCRSRSTAIHAATPNGAGGGAGPSADLSMLRRGGTNGRLRRRCARHLTRWYAGDTVVRAGAPARVVCQATIRPAARPLTQGDTLRIGDACRVRPFDAESVAGSRGNSPGPTALRRALLAAVAVARAARRARSGLGHTRPVHFRLRSSTGQAGRLRLREALR